MYDAYLFDMDGTLYLGDQVLPHAAETVAGLRAAGKRTVFLSNNPTRTREQYAAKLSGMGITTPAEDILNSSLVMVRWLQQAAPGARLFVVGKSRLRATCGRRASSSPSVQPRSI